MENKLYAVSGRTSFDAFAGLDSRAKLATITTEPKSPKSLPLLGIFHKDLTMPALPNLLLYIV